MRIPAPRSHVLSLSLARPPRSERILGDISGRLHGSIFPRRRRVPVRGSAVEPADVGRSVGPARSAGLAVRSPLQAALTFRVRTARAFAARPRARRACALSLSLSHLCTFLLRHDEITATFRGRELVRRPDQSPGFPARAGSPGRLEIGEIATTTGRRDRAEVATSHLRPETTRDRQQCCGATRGTDVFDK